MPHLHIRSETCYLDIQLENALEAWLKWQGVRVGVWKVLGLNLRKRKRGKKLPIKAEKKVLLKNCSDQMIKDDI